MARTRRPQKTAAPAAAPAAAPMPLRTPVISLGAGVQSSTLLLMAAEGEFDVTPAVAVFADTQAEPRAVYKWLDFLKRTAGERIPIEVATLGNLRADIEQAVAAGSTRSSKPPLFTRNPDGTKGFTPRACTRDYKIRPMRARLRELGYGPKNPIETWLGITTDEIERMKTSDVKWAANRWPLIERRMSREDCLQWMADRGYPRPPKSACTFCPYHSDAMWRNLRDDSPEEWNEAVEFDLVVRRLPGMRGDGYLHRQRVPLDQVDLSPDGELKRGTEEDFNSECEGMCGV